VAIDAVCILIPQAAVNFKSFVGATRQRAAHAPGLTSRDGGINLNWLAGQIVDIGKSGNYL
jgi:hypothetical protein